MGPGNKVWLTIKIFLLISIICLCHCEDDAEVRVKTRPKYTELRRSQKVSVSTTTEVADEDEEKDASSEEVDKPHYSIARQPPVEDSSEEEEDDSPRSNARQPPSPSPNGRTKQYVEFVRPGATPRPKTPKTTTTRAPKRKVDKNARPEGCNACRYYCKQCRGAEEVTSGGVWGCCNHNCCGGRCSCQKTM